MASRYTRNDAETHEAWYQRLVGERSAIDAQIYEAKRLASEDILKRKHNERVERDRKALEARQAPKKEG